MMVASQSRDPEKIVFVLQGGGALGAYQAGAYEALCKAGQEPEWLAGISIGSINAALIAGNPPSQRLQALRRFWEGVTGAPWLMGTPLEGALLPDQMRAFCNESRATMTTMLGAPGFFRPRMPDVFSFLPGLMRQTSWYDTAPLRETLLELVDFDLLNGAGPRLTVCAVDVQTGNFTSFDSSETRITVDHIMASGALPPGFPAVEIDGRHYWDGGLVSNSPCRWCWKSRTSARSASIRSISIPRATACPIPWPMSSSASARSASPAAPASTPTNSAPAMRWPAPRAGYKPGCRPNSATIPT
ncbi:MAG: patatin-like phospholipase family protein [Paracoccus aminovorans]|nr:patatin-like phospholipase family protein [Paracoccus aminovorans]